MNIIKSCFSLRDWNFKVFWAIFLAHSSFLFISGFKAAGFFFCCPARSNSGEGRPTSDVQFTFRPSNSRCESALGKTSECFSTIRTPWTWSFGWRRKPHGRDQRAAARRAPNVEYRVKGSASAVAWMTRQSLDRAATRKVKDFSQGCELNIWEEHFILGEEIGIFSLFVRHFCTSVHVLCRDREVVELLL